LPVAVLQGNKAINPELGEIALTLKSVIDSLVHGGKPNPFKAIAFSAIKNILEKGTVVLNASHDRQESYYICAPIIIDNKEHIGTVLVKRDSSNQRMYLHSVSVKEKLLNYQFSRADISKDKSETPRPTNLEALQNIAIKHINGKANYSDVINILQNYLTLDLVNQANNQTNIKENKELDMQENLTQIEQIQNYIDAEKAAEQDANLVASYSLNLDKLIDALKQEGLALPTINVSEFDKINHRFGEITLMANSELISPNAQNEVKLYAGNLYEMRMPFVFLEFFKSG